jgi:lipopolysaccharide/colanic/teichoic acid biosynthesis glycosyltransferase
MAVNVAAGMAQVYRIAAAQSSLAFRRDTLRDVGKNLFDSAVTVAVAPFALVVVAVMALILAVDLRGNPFFTQTRIGKNGKPFTMYKLRTMRHAAPGTAPTYLIDDWNTYVFSPPGERDPRVTRWGEFARKTSIDELPQLLNVFKGEMSIVGPRPELPEIVAQYPPEYHRRHDVLPGIAGLAQVSGRSDLTYDEIVTHDLVYVDSHSVMTDIHILWRTLRLVFTREGAR